MDNNSKDVIVGNDLTASGATLTTDRFGHVGGAYYLDGTNDNLTTSSNVGISGNDNRTLVYWQKVDRQLSTDDGDELIVYWGNPLSGEAFGTWIHGSDNISFYGGTDSHDNITKEVASNIWEQWAVVYDGSRVSLYKNGSMTKSFQTSLDTTSTELVVGQRGGVDDFEGSIDDIRIYNRALNLAEIQALYHVYDPQPPFVIDTHPDNNTSIGVSDNLTVTFSEAVDPSSLSGSITLTRDNGTQVAIDNLTFDNASSPFTLTIDPSAGYTADNYTLNISTDLRDLSGNALQQNFVIQFEAQ
jgi:hypothetical protein